VDLGRAQAILDAAHDAFISMDDRGRISYWNPAAMDMFGYSRAEAIGRDLADTIMPERLRAAHRAGLARFVEEGIGPVLDQRIEVVGMRRDMSEFAAELTVSLLAEPDGWSFHAFVQDISDRKQAEGRRAERVSRLEALARTDELTGLANRRGWDEELAREMARAERTGQLLSVVLLDLDHFKRFNDRFGHLAGDHLLAALGPRWREQLRRTDVLARYGGEEFALALPACPPRDTDALMRRLRESMPEGQTFSAGVAVWDGEESADELLARADRALYEAKAAGRDRFIHSAAPPPARGRA
jgi:two-component system cell cycle response regulator